MDVGDRVLTPKGTGRIRRIAAEVRWADGTPLRESLIVVQLDNRPETAMRPVFYARQVEPIADDIEVEIDDAR